MLTKEILREWVFPMVGEYLGVPPGTAGLPRNKIPRQKGTVALEILGEADVYPPVPSLPLEAWTAIVSYYLQTAPDEPIFRETEPAISPTTPQFEVLNPGYRTAAPFTTLTKIDVLNQRIYLGDSAERSLTVLDGDGVVVEKMELGLQPTAIDIRPDELWITAIGFIYPSDHPQGRLVIVKRDESGAIEPDAVLRGLARPSFTSFADLNKDGHADIIMSEFGNLVGHLSWFENVGDGSYTERLLNDRPGALSHYTHDFNGDGWLDIITLMGQAKEGVFIYYNLGNGEFQESYEIQWPPSFGAAHMSLLDFDGDGDMDVLTANGDNADYAAIAKRYHGVRLYLNDGGNHFEQAFFYPQHGAYKALAVDFDKDGDRDIAAISFFPDYDGVGGLESFVYLENLGDMAFTASTFPEALDARWLTMDAGDVDGDGDADIVLGGSVLGAGKVPKHLKQKWQEGAPSLLILKNRLVAD